MGSTIEKEGPIGQVLFSTRGAESLPPQERYGELIENSVSVILQEQHPVTGLFPAATKKHHIERDHYLHTWVRDSSMVAATFFDPIPLNLQDSSTKKSIIASGARFIHGMLNVFASEPWKESFAQNIDTKKDEYGRQYTTLTKEAPPIHLQMDGKQCSWPTQNQPDSWGEFLISLGLGLKQGLFTVDAKQQDTIESIAKYLLRIKVADLEQFSMWEWGRIRHPAPISSVAIVAKGLEQISPFVSVDSKESIRRAVSNARIFVEHNYPRDYTIPFGHHSETDLATLVAYGLGALDGFFLSPYFIKANKELGNGQHPGKKRYIGDHYYRGDGESGEAIWPMGALFEAKIFLEKAISSFKNEDHDTGRKFQLRGVACLKKLADLRKKHGYIPELLEQRDGKLIPNNNHLLWNEALAIQVYSRAEVAENLNPARLN